MEKKVEEFNPFTTYVSHLEGQGIFLNEEDMRELYSAAIENHEYCQNVGYLSERVKYSSIEKAFQEQWLKENRPASHIGNGCGLLQDLFLKQGATRTNPLNFSGWTLEINQRDRYIAATIIQWLGTNVGMGFLKDALNRVGMTITQKKPTNE